jgi:hypothetical protein
MRGSWLVVCAWCGRAKDAAGDPIEGIPPRAPDSHGICTECAATVRAEIERMHAARKPVEATR